MHVIDSHTGGEPTRVILSGGPDLGAGTIEEQAQILARDHGDWLNAVLAEPRGQPAMVAALLVPPTSPGSVTGVIYFDPAAVIGMCGHGTIGLAVTLAHMGKIGLGAHTIIDPSPIAVETKNIRAMTDLAVAIREAINGQRAPGPGEAMIDHVIFQHAVPDPSVHSRSFVLCPDDTYDRSPCGTGSSARLACLAAAGTLEPGKIITHESVIGSRFDVSYQPGPNGGVLPTLQGKAHIMSEAQLVFDPADPFRTGVPL